MKLSTIISARAVIASLGNESVSPKLGYKFIKFLSKTSDEQQLFQDKYRELATKYADIAEDGTFKVHDEDVEAFNAGYKALNNVEVEDTGIKFTLEELNEVKLTVTQLASLYDFIEE